MPLAEAMGAGEVEGHTVKDPVTDMVEEALESPPVADTVEEGDCEAEGV